METTFQGLGFKVSQTLGYLFGGPHNKDCSISGSILASPSSGKVPYTVITWALKNYVRAPLGPKYILNCNT